MFTKLAAGDEHRKWRCKGSTGATDASDHASLTCLPDPDEALLARRTRDFGGVAQRPEAHVTFVALQTLTWGGGQRR